MEGADRVPARDTAAARGAQPPRVAAQEASKGAARGGTKTEYTWAPGRVAHAQHAELVSSFKPSPNFYAPLRGLGAEPDLPPPVPPTMPPPKTALYLSPQQDGMETRSKGDS